MTKRTCLRIRPILFSSLTFFLVALSVSALLFHPVSGSVELIVNGGFEDDWKGWEKYSLGRGYAALDPAYPHSGQYSLSIQGTATPLSGVVYGSGVNQTVEAAGLPLDLEFGFWVKPSLSGLAAAEMKAVLTLHLMHQTSGPKILKMVYYVAWEGGAESWANVRPDEADYFLHDIRAQAWNYYQGSVRDDFENRWGASTGYSLSKIVLTFQIAVTNVARDTQYVNWDDVSLTAPQTTATTATTVTSSTKPTGTQTTSQQWQNMHLKVGDWWSLKGTSHRASQGHGFGVGGMTTDKQYSGKFTVTNLDSGRITISYHWSESWTYTSTGNWDPGPNGNDEGTMEYVIDLASLNVVDGTEGAKDWIGYPPWFLVNPTVLREGSTIQRGAWVLSDDAKSNEIKSVAWSVGKLQTIQIENYGVSAWSLSFTGPRQGNYRHKISGGYDYSTGSETLTEFYDSIYGIRLGDSISGNFKLERSDGGFTETYEETMQFDDTNLDFSVPTTSMSTQTTETASISTVMMSVVTQTVVAEPFSIGSTGLMAVIGLVAVIAIVTAWMVIRARRKPRPTSVVAEKFCIECGKPLRADQRFCPSCGKAQN